MMREIKRKVALLLSFALITQVVTASAVYGKENTESMNEVSMDTVSPEEVPPDTVSFDEGVSADTPGEDAAGETSPDIQTEISSDTVYPVNAGSSSLTDETEELNKLLKEKCVKAVFFGDGAYRMRTEPNADAPGIADIYSGTTVVMSSVVYDGQKLWVYGTALQGERCPSGYIERDRLICVDEDFVSAEQRYDGRVQSFRGGYILNSQISAAIDSFPENYRDKLYELSSRHPNWVFVSQDMGSLTLDRAVDGEYSNKNRNWVWYTAPASYKEGMPENDKSGKWYYASRSCIEYYMNPINFLDDSHVFQFEQLVFNESSHTLAGVQSILNGTFMAGKIEDDSRTYAEAFMEIGKSLKLSPYHLSSRVRQEQGVNGTSDIISGKYPGYEGYYNYFNIQATGSKDKVIENGLIYAKSQGWDTRYKSLYGGAAYIGNRYIGIGQDTLYLQKFDLVGTEYYTHQYMQNIQAPSSEAVSTYNQYRNVGELDNAFVFKIPAFKDASQSGAVPADETVNVVPKTTFTLIKKANLFYGQDLSESYARYKVRSNAEILSIEVSDAMKNAAGSRPYFTVYDYSNDILTLKTVNRTGSNTKDTYKKLVLSVTYDGYPKTDLSLNVTAVNNAPVIKTAPAIIYSGYDTGAVALTDSAGNSVSLPDDTKVMCSDSSVTCEPDIKESLITVHDGAFKAGTKKFTLTSGEWMRPVTISAAVKKGGVPALRPAVKNVTLNTNIRMDEYGTTDVRIGVDGTGIKVDELTVSAGNARTEAVLGSGINAVYDGTRYLKLGVKGKDIANGTYPLVLNGSFKNADGSRCAMKAVTLNVKVTDTSPEKMYTFKASGNINTVDRADTCILLIPSVAGTGAVSVNSVKSDSDLFTVSLLKKGDITPDGREVGNAAGAIVLKAKDGVSLNIRQTYPVNITSALNNGLVITKQVNVKPVQKPAKIVGNIIRATMTRSSSVSRNYIIRSYGNSKADTVIEKVELDKEGPGQYFTFTPAEGQGSGRTFGGVLRLNDTSVKNGVYTLKFRVTLKGHAENANPLTVKISIRVK